MLSISCSNKSTPMGISHTNGWPSNKQLCRGQTLPEVFATKPIGMHPFHGVRDEETKRAMMKSYQTSGGTVLSTNWKEVATKDYEKEITAPNGQEVKKWTDM